MDRIKNTVRSLVAVMVAFGGLVALSGPAAAEAPAPTPQQARFEVDFMMDTIDHHYLGVRMGQMCVERATAPPPSSDQTLRDTCAQIVATQTQEIQQLQTWLADWYGITKEPELPPNGDAMLDKLARREGESFDIEVSRMFIQHHQSFLPVADKCTETAAHAELRDLCAQMYDTQAREIDVFTSILNDHGLNRQGPRGRPGGR